MSLIALAALAALGVVWQVRGASFGSGSSSGETADAVIDAVVDGVIAFVDNSVQVLGVVVIVFLAVEWLGAGRAPRRRWDPRSLPPLEDEDRVGRAGLAVGMAILVVLIAWLVLWRDEVGVLGHVNGEWAVLMRPTPGFWRLAPWLISVWAVELVVDGLVLVRGRWTGGLRVADLAVKLAGLVVLGLLVATPDLVAFDRQALAATLPPERAADLTGRVEPLLGKLVRFGLACGWVAAFATFGARLWRLLRGR